MRAVLRRPPGIAATSLRLLPAQLVLRGGEALFPVLLAAWFGRSVEMDRFVAGWALFSFAGAFVLDAHRDSALVPVIAEMRRRDPRALAGFLGSVLMHTMVLAAVLGAIVATGMAVVTPGATLLAAGFALHLTASSARVFLGAVSNAVHRFFAPVAAAATGMVFTIAAVALARGRTGVAVVPAAMALGELVAFLLVLRATRRAGIVVAPSLERTLWVGRFARQSIVQVAGNALARANPAVDQMVAALVGVTGGGTLLRLASDVALAPGTLLGTTVLPVLLTHLADLGAEGRHADLARLVRRSALIVTGVMAVAGAVLALAARPLLRAVYLHGAMDPAGVETMARILPAFVAGLPGLGLLLVLARAHVALGNSRALLVGGIVGGALNAGLDLLLMGPLGLPGLALGTTIATTAVAVAFVFMLRARLREVGEDRR